MENGDGQNHIERRGFESGLLDGLSDEAHVRAMGGLRPPRRLHDRRRREFEPENRPDGRRERQFVVSESRSQ